MTIANLPSSRRVEDPSKCVRGFLSGMASCTKYLIRGVDCTTASAFKPSICHPWGIKDIIILSRMQANGFVNFYDGSPTVPGPLIARVYSLGNDDKMFSFIGCLPIISGLVVHSSISGICITVVGNKK